MKKDKWFFEMAIIKNDYKGKKNAFGKLSYDRNSTIHWKNPPVKSPPDQTSPPFDFHHAKTVLKALRPSQRRQIMPSN